MTKVVTCAAPIAASLFKTGLTSSFKPAAIFSATFLALIYIGSPLRAAEAAPDPAGFDILGMKLGMSVAEIEAAIKAYNPSLAIITTKSKMYDQSLGLGYVGKFVQFVQAGRQPPGAFPEFISVGFTVTEPGRAFYIGRYTNFSLEQQPLVEKTVQQLREKYGPESWSSDGSRFDWVFDEAGKQLFQTCPNGAFSYGVRAQFGALVAPQSYSSECGIDLEVRLVPSTNPHLLSNLFEQLVGDSIAADDIRKTLAEAKAEKEQQRQQQEQKALGVKPPL